MTGKYAAAALSLALALLLIVPSSALSDDWSGTIGVSIWPAAIEGQTQAGNVTIPLNVIMSDFKVSPSVRSEVNKNRWSIALDLRWLGASEDNITLFAKNGNSIIGDWDYTQIETELWVGFRALARPRLTLDIFAGGRYNHQNMDVTINATKNNGIQGTETLTGGFKENWIDPLIGVRVLTDAEKKWWFNVRGDVGGFDVGSKLAWNAHALAAFRVSKDVDLTAGLKFIDIDYTNDASGADAFAYNAQQSGIVIGAVFRLQ